MMKFLLSSTAAAAFAALSACTTPISETPSAPVSEAVEPAVAEAIDPRVIHERLVVMDTHLDTPALLVQPGFDITNRYDVALHYSQVDLPRMLEGDADGGYWVIYTPQGPLTEEAYAGALESAIKRAEAIQNMVASHPDKFELALNSEDAERIEAAGKRIVYVSMENAYPLGEDLSRLEMFYDMGLRMVGPLHFANNQLGDSSTDSEGTVWEGLSPLGKEMVAEANRLGIILDGSHAHDLVFDDLIELSATPIILSHTGAKAIYDHPRNIDDERLKTLAANGGVIHMNAFGGYLKKLEQDPARGAAMGKLFAELQSAPITTVEERDAFLAKRRAIDAEFPPAMANFEDYMEHFLYVLELIGPDHVGVGADWDGGGGVEGMNDISAFPRITERLLAEGYTEEDLAKIWGGNVKRLLKAAEDYKASLASEEG